MAILIDPPQWPAHGTLWSHLVSDADYEELIRRWNEPHRRYHDERHLEDVLFALNQLGVRGEQV
ncbi:MAG: DUF4031 domain-containing protein, partial [Actinobacteria bacterium]|nr:DUF4031 domain-containing protein [Actinomycetota bacterium]